MAIADGGRRDLKARKVSMLTSTYYVKPEDPPEDYVLQEGLEVTPFTKLSEMC